MRAAALAEGAKAAAAAVNSSATEVNRAFTGAPYNLKQTLKVVL